MFKTDGLRKYQWIIAIILAGFWQNALLLTTFLRNVRSVWFLRICLFLSLNRTRCNDTTHVQFVFDSWSASMKSNKRELLYSIWTGLVFFPHKKKKPFISLPGSRSDGRRINVSLNNRVSVFHKARKLRSGFWRIVSTPRSTTIVSFLTRTVPTLLPTRCQCQRLPLSVSESQLNNPTIKICRRIEWLFEKTTFGRKTRRNNLTSNRYEMLTATSTD